MYFVPKFFRINQQYEFGQAKFYLNKMSSKLKYSNTGGNITIQTLNVDNQSTLPHIFAKFNIKSDLGI